MIFLLLRRIFKAIGRLVIPPRSQDVAKVNPNVRCPVCGWPLGELRCVALADEKGKQSIFAQHRCRRCGARHFENPVVKVGPLNVQPAVPRNEIEIREDAQRFLSQGPQRETRTN